MSKNSPIQNYECARAFGQVMESLRKKQQRQQQSNQPKKHVHKKHDLACLMSQYMCINSIN